MIIMKPAEEWKHEIPCDPDYYSQDTINIIKQIQLDAMKEGARRAMCRRSNLKEGEGEYIQGYNYALSEYECEIFTAAEKWTEKDLL